MRDTQKEREGQRHRQREKQAPCREPDMGLHPGSPGSGPGLKAALTTGPPGVPFFSNNIKRLPCPKTFSQLICWNHPWGRSMLLGHRTPESVSQTLDMLT